MKRSAGILLYRKNKGDTEFFLVHPGGPFWAGKDAHAWSIPKGELLENEEPLHAAMREFDEETGLQLPDLNYRALAPVKMKSGKVVLCFAAEGDVDPEKFIPGTFEMEWPPRSGKMKSFPEADRGGWFNAADARNRLNEAQIPFLDEVLNGIIRSR